MRLLRHALASLLFWLSAKLMEYAARSKPERSARTVVGGFSSVRPRERAAYDLGAAMHEAFAPKAIDLDPSQAYARAFILGLHSPALESRS